MKKNHVLTGIILFMSLALVVSSCKKDEHTTAPNTTTTSNEALADRIFDNVGNISNEAYSLQTSTTKTTDGARLFIGDCAVITLDTLGFPFTLTVDFGTENCLCEDGHYRRGQIIAHFTGPYWQAGTVITHTLNNYFVDDNGVEGTRVLTNLGPNADGFMEYNIEAEGEIFLANSDDRFTWTSSRTRIWIEGYDSFTHFDDVYLISGVSSGVRVTGETWQRITLEPLRLELDCRHIVSGILQITSSNGPDMILDFGTGDCDNVAYVTVNGVVYTIMLP